MAIWRFQYRKRYEITCDAKNDEPDCGAVEAFQYRKRYEITCDFKWHNFRSIPMKEFQYRKRYEITCDKILDALMSHPDGVSIPQAV